MIAMHGRPKRGTVHSTTMNVNIGSGRDCLGHNYVRSAWRFSCFTFSGVADAKPWLADDVDSLGFRRFDVII